LKKVEKMHVLAIDVSVNGCSVAVLNTETGVSHQKRMETDRGQAEFLIPMIENIVQEANLTMKDIHFIVVTRGPGSFTGVRIGLATAKTLGLALNIPVFGFSTLDVMARTYPDDQHTLFLIDTKRDDFYGQVGEGTDPKIWTVEEVENYKGATIKDVIPDILILAKMGAEKYTGQSGYDPHQAPTPLYLREAEVSESKKKVLNIL
jgi:tRNA threonylcarbamoyl adenosine modification protein YeaZ